MILMTTMWIYGLAQCNEKELQQVIAEAKAMRVQMDDIEFRMKRHSNITTSAGVLYGIGGVSILYYSGKGDRTFLVGGLCVGVLGTALLISSSRTLVYKF